MLSLTLINTYTDSGQLMCILCKSIVRNETIWPVHLNSKIHKENIALAKKTKLETESTVVPPSISTFKEPLSQNGSNKKIKGILKNSIQPVVHMKSNIPADFFDDNLSKVNSESIIQKSENKEATTSSDIQHIKIEEEKEKEKVKDSNLATLPEGFFDDPVKDAKVRLSELQKFAINLQNKNIFIQNI